MLVAIAITLIIMVGLYIIKPTQITIRHISEISTYNTSTINSHAKQEIVENIPAMTEFNPDEGPKDPNDVSFAETMKSMNAVMSSFTNFEKEER